MIVVDGQVQTAGILILAKVDDQLSVVITRLSTENSGEVVTKQIHMFLGWCDKPGALVPPAPDIAEAAWVPLATAVDSLPYKEDRAAFLEWFSPALAV